MQYYIVIFILGVFNHQILLANEQKQRINDAYERVDQSYEISCSYVNPSSYRLIRPLGKTQRSYGKLSRVFHLISNEKESTFKFDVLKSDRKEGKYKVQFNNGLIIEDHIKSRSDLIDVNERNTFYLPTKKIDRSFRRFSYEHELYKIACKVFFAVEKETLINDSHHLHINVHPHDKYDYKNLTVDRVNHYLKSHDYKSYVLLEEGNFKGNLVDLSDFLEMKPYYLIKNYYPESILIPRTSDILVSPAGHNRYYFAKDTPSITVLYTGGNHNYCMWNNTRRLLTGLLNSQSKAKLKIQYDASAIVVQPRGLVGLNFTYESLKKNNLLKDVLASDAAQAYEYTKKYFNYFAYSFLDFYQGMYKTLEINHRSLYGDYSIQLKGSGERHLKVEIEYINL